MAKIIRPTYPLEFSIGLLLLIFVLSSLLSFEIFSVRWNELVESASPVTGMILVGASIVVMSLIVWEEFLFPIRIKPMNEEIVFRNHFTKLKTQVLSYCLIPTIVVFVYLNYEVVYVPFFIWASVCMVTPLGKIVPGIKNYNDFLKINDAKIEYKNNEKEGTLLVKDIQGIVLIRDETSLLHKIQVVMKDERKVVIDLDEMELEAYYQTIDDFINGHYKPLIVRHST